MSSLKVQVENNDNVCNNQVNCNDFSKIQHKSSNNNNMLTPLINIDTLKISSSSSSDEDDVMTIEEEAAAAKRFAKLPDNSEQRRYAYFTVFFVNKF